MRLEFPPEEGSIGQYESPSEEGGEEGRRDEDGVERRERGWCYQLLHTRVNSLVGQEAGTYLIDLFTFAAGNSLVKLRRQLNWD